jgi:ribosomal protein S18 acetylase RimI-like enzyme
LHPNDIHIALATKADLPAIARIHKQAFPHSFSTALGQRYREKMLEWYLSTDKTFILVSKTADGTVTGYVTAIVQDYTLKTGSASGMAQYSFQQGILSLAMRPWLLFHKELRRKYGFILENLKGKVFGQKAPVQKPENKHIPAYVGLVIIAVSESYAGKGIGGALIREFEHVSASQYHLHDVFLSVESDNERAIRTYEREGWERQGLYADTYRFWKKI